MPHNQLTPQATAAFNARLDEILGGIAGADGSEASYHV